MTSLTGVALLVAALTSACASAAPSSGTSPGPSASVSNTETGALVRLNDDSKAVSVAVAAQPDRVWGVIPAVYGRLGIPTEINDAFARTTGTRSFTQARLDGKRTLDWIRCGNQGAGPSSGGMYRTRLSITTTARAAANGRTDLVTEITGTATPVEGTSTGPVACSSTGDLEQRIRMLVLEELRR